MPDATVLCPSCYASLKMPDAVPIGHYVKCPRCSLQVRKSAKAGAAKPPADDFFAKVNLNALATEPAAAAPPPAKKAVASVVPTASPRRFPLAPLAGGAALLLCGLAIDLTIRLQAPTTPTPSAANEPVAARPPETPTKVQPVADIKPPPQPAAVPPPAAPPKPTPPAPSVGIAHWGQDFEAAKQTARRDNRDVLLLFTGSDWCPPCMALEKNVLREPEFDAWLRQRFEPVVVDFPRRDPAAMRRVRDAARNQRLSAEVFAEAVEGYPTLLLTDADGRPYAQECGGMERDELRAWLGAAISQRDERDGLISAIGAATGAAKARAIQRAVTYVQKLDRKLAAHRHYAADLRTWAQQARDADPDNTVGAGELAFVVHWARRAEAATKLPADATRDRALVDEFATWREGHRWHNAERAAFLHEYAASLRLGLGESAAALAELSAGLAAQPPDPWPARLATGKALDVNFGTAFLVDAVGPRRTVLTVSALVQGPGRLWVRAGDKLHDATVVADDAATGLALVEFADAKYPAKVLRPVARADLPAGTTLVAVGHPDDTADAVVAKSAARTDGVRTALLQPALKPAALRGAPLFDAKGSLVGVAVHEPAFPGTVDGAVRVAEVCRFLKAHLGKEFVPATPFISAASPAETAKRCRDNGFVVRVWKSRR